MLSTTGRHEEALKEAARGHELDRISPINNTRDAAFLYYARRYDEATARLQQTLELDPNFWIAHYYLGKNQLELAKTNDALVELQKAVELSHGNPEPIGGLGYLFARTGNQTQAQDRLTQLQALMSRRYVAPYHVALIHAGLGDAEEAVTWLEKGFAERDPRMAWLKVEPSWDGVRNNGRFQELLRKLHLD